MLTLACSAVAQAGMAAATASLDDTSADAAGVRGRVAHHAPPT